MTNIIQLEANAYPYPSIPQNSSLYPTKHQIKMRKKQSRADKELAKQERELGYVNEHTQNTKNSITYEFTPIAKFNWIRKKTDTALFKNFAIMPYQQELAIPHNELVPTGKEGIHSTNPRIQLWTEDGRKIKNAA